MNHTELSIEKSTIECYKIRSKSFTWADITIDAKGNAGRIQIASDFGDWQNYWGHCGCDFKSFLAEISFDYAAGKFGAKKWIDVNATIKHFKQEVLRERREESIDADKAREIWDEILEIADESHSTIADAIYRAHNLFAFMGYDPDLCYEPNPHFKSFWLEIWPALLAEFAREAVTA